MFFDPMYFVFLAPAMILALWAQTKTQSAFRRYSQVGNAAGLTGAEAAAAMLRSQGIDIVSTPEEAQRRQNAAAIVRIGGFLSDHYDPRARVLRLSPQVYGGRSLSAVGVACHEAGHAMQHAHNYALLGMRTALVPVASIGSWLSFPLIILGFILSSANLVGLGIAAFSLIVLFQLITLPVEFDASRRAKLALGELNIAGNAQEARGVAIVLNAAAWTYVAAAFSAVMTLLYYLWVFSQSQSRN
jgi:uncharacterized protein